MAHSLHFSYVLTYVTLIFFHSYVSAQYIQNYEVRYIPDPNGVNHRQNYWTPTQGADAQQVVDLYPEAVFLEYNCHYMRDICRNARDFYASTRGKNHSPQTQFAYDLNTRKNERGDKRRDRSCPTGDYGWKTFHTCPEPDQNIVMRHDGPWDYKDLEPGTTMNNIRNKRNSQGTVTEYSKIRYSCDEFPPASWVEGGSGLTVPGNGANAGNAFTRCAAMRCAKGAKAEQDWQGLAHGRLRRELIFVTRRRTTTPYYQYPGFNTQSSAIFFQFRMASRRDGVAARIYTYADPSLTQLQRTPIDVKQAKRALDDRANFDRWVNTVTMDELVASRNGSMHLIHANDTFAEMAMMDGMGLPNMGMGFGSGAVLGLDEDYFSEDEDKYTDDDTDADVDADVEVPGHPPKDTRSQILAPRRISESAITPLANNATPSDIEKARAVVEDAILASAKLNRARLASPLRNKYTLKPGTVIGGSGQSRRRELDGGTEIQEPPHLLEITDEIARAAALVSEYDALQEAGDLTRRQAAGPGTFWMEHLDRKGTVPWGDDPDYKVFRNVHDYGAVGDGVTDDTQAIKDAMNDGKRCGKGCNGSTTKNAIVYFPPGTYLVSTTIPLPFGTQVIGDANSFPTIVASRNFIGLGVLSTNEYTGGGIGADGLDQQWYINTANFYRQIRNLRIDITSTRAAQEVAGLHYQVAQATSLQNVEIIAAEGSTQQGIFAENGSGGVMADVTFRGGAFGIYGGSQQFTAQRLVFDGCATGVQVIWDWGWVWKSITMTNVGVGFRLLREETGAGGKAKRQKKEEGNIGSASFIDSSFTNVGTAVLIAPPSSDLGVGSTGVIIENVEFSSVTQAVADTSGATLLEASGKVDHWALGPVYSSDGKREFSSGAEVPGFRRHHSLLDANGGYLERAKPQYEDRAAGDFVHLKDFGARGDGSTDDTAAIQTALYASQGKILFVDAGSYILTGTVIIPINSKIVGETWSQFVASGPYFGDASNPKVMIKVGRESDVGDIEMQDLMFTSRGATAGLVLVEWNVKAASPGSAGLWDCHVRIGGATGTELTPAECPAFTDGTKEECNAASLMMHITPKASGYFENMWLWVADHMIDDPDQVDANNTMVQCSLYVARGLLVESQEPVWLYGTSSEHAVYYQYNFHNARHIFAGMIQTESPYFQPTPPPPAPFEGAVGVFPGDPDYSCDGEDEFSGCDESWGVIIRRSGSVFIAGAGIYSWFSTYTQECVDPQACQKVLILIEENSSNVRIQHLITIGAEYMAVQDGVGIPAIDNLNVEHHPRWSQVSVFDVSASGPDYQDAIWIDPSIWEMDIPSFTCAPPCLVKLPPWTGATSVVNYPLITVSDGAWTSTITRAPLTISEWVFQAVTLDDANGRLKARQEFDDFWPIPATTPIWPAVRFVGPNGEETVTAPSGPFPTPPPSIGPGAAPPPQGNWPRNAVRPVRGWEQMPLVGECYFLDFEFNCLPSPWEYEGVGGAPEEGDEESQGEFISCPPEPTTKTTTTTKVPEPTKIALDIARPSDNEWNCYDGGRKTTHVRLDNAINSFCSELGDKGDVFDQGFFKESKFDLPRSGSNPIPLQIVISMAVKQGCEWLWNANDCARYLRVPVDSCNCGGVNGKQGGDVKNNCLEWRIDPNNKW